MPRGSLLPQAQAPCGPQIIPMPPLPCCSAATHWLTAMTHVVRLMCGVGAAPTASHSPLPRGQTAGCRNTAGKKFTSLMSSFLTYLVAEGMHAVRPKPSLSAKSAQPCQSKVITSWCPGQPRCMLNLQIQHALTGMHSWVCTHFRLVLPGSPTIEVLNISKAREARPSAAREASAVGKSHAVRQ